MLDNSVVIVGALGAGKTCLAQSLVYNTVLNSLSTVSPLCYRLDNYVLWDTPGQDKYSWASEPLLWRSKLVLYCVSLEDFEERHLECPKDLKLSEKHCVLAPRLEEYNKLCNKVLVVYTKADLQHTHQLAAELQQLEDCCVVSAVNKLGLEKLKQKIRESLTACSQQSAQHCVSQSSLTEQSVALSEQKDPSGEKQHPGGGKKCVL